MKVEFLRPFSKDLDKISSKSVKNQIKGLIVTFESAENIQSISNTKKLKGHRNAYRIRLGDYRLGFFLENNEIQFARILHRKDIYKIFP